MGVKSRLKKILPKWLYKPLLPLYHWSRAVFANVRYGFPARKLYIVGVTGTNGKTTTTNMIGSVLETAGHKVGILSSAVVQVGNNWEDSHLTLTTEDVSILQKYLKRMKNDGVTHVVLEVSSHAIAQSRIWGIPFQGAVFTNLTQDHLDYHHDMDEYASTKRKLIKRAKQFVILNGDDSWFDFFNVREREMTTVYGTTDKCDIRVRAAQITNHGSKSLLSTPEGKVEINLNLTGKFNVYNAMAAVGVAQRMNIPEGKLKQGLEGLEKVPGRMESINEGQKFSVMIDHAHTPDALDNLLENLRRTTEKELLVIVGADGERDPSKRVPIGRTVAKYADRVYVTDQEPYSDEPEPIRREVIRGLQTAGFHDYEEIADRRKAIDAALRRAQKGDLVLVTGLGNQKYRGMVEGKIEWDDREVVREEIAEVLSQKKPEKTPKKKSTPKRKSTKKKSSTKKKKSK